MNTLVTGILWGIGIWIGWKIAEECLPTLCEEFKKGWDDSQPKSVNK